MTRKTAAVGLLLLAGVVACGQACPAVAVVIAETVVIHRVPQLIPEPAAEAALVNRLLEYGLDVLDLGHVQLLRATEDGVRDLEYLVKRALVGETAAIRFLAVSDEAAADILVVGEAISTVTASEALAFPGQPPVEDGRAQVEVRAIEVRTGRVLAGAVLHAGGVDPFAELAGKRSLARAGDKIACPVAQAIAESYPAVSQCFRGCAPPAPTFGVLSFELRGPTELRGMDVSHLLTAATERALSERGCATAKAFAGDYILTGAITDWNEVKTPAFNMPGLAWLWQDVEVRLMVEVRVLDVSTMEFATYEVRVNVRGGEIFGLRFGTSPEDIARAAAAAIASRVK